MYGRNVLSAQFDRGVSIRSMNGCSPSRRKGCVWSMVSEFRTHTTVQVHWLFFLPSEECGLWSSIPHN